MEKLKPKLFSVLKNYTKEQFIKDVISGVIVAIIALPLSIALAIASGVSPEQGLYTAIIAGFMISLFGGSRVQIGGPTAAFVIIIYGVIQEYGLSGLTIATIMAGIILIIMGLLKFGNLIKFIPYTITTGFTSGIAIGIFMGQIKDFFGLKMDAVPSEFVHKITTYASTFSTLQLSTLSVGLISLLILIVCPKITDKLPGSLIAIVVTTLLVKFLPIEVSTIGNVYGELSSDLPHFTPIAVDYITVKRLLQPAFTIAILAGIESLLSCVVSDGMIGSRHRSNMELIGQGIGNIFSGLLGGIPATGAIARTAANVKNGGRTPVAGIVHSITLLLILVLLMPLAALIPMPTLAAILIVVAYNMSEWREFVTLLKTSTKSDITVLVTTFLLTVFFDLVIAIEIGIVMAALLFMKRMAEETNVRGWKYIDDMDEDDILDPDSIALKIVPKHTLVYEINGPMFFGAADKFLTITTSNKEKVKVVILRMRSVPAMDATALHVLQKVCKTCKKKKITVIFSHVTKQPLELMKKAGLYESVGELNFCPSINLALLRAEELVE